MADQPLSLSSTFANSSRTLSSTVLQDSAYVISLASLQSHYALATSAPSNAIHLLDKSDCKSIVNSLPGHNGGITYMRTATATQGARQSLMSCGQDGAVKIWDERSGAAGIQMSNSGRKLPLLSCDVSPDGLTAAAGSVLQGNDATILYWDLRNPAAPLRKHTSTHSDDITAVHFSQAGSTQTLLSASTDGLLCFSDPLEDDEDEANTSVRNWGCSISKAGWTRSENGQPQVWAVSDMETVSIWTDELDSVQDVDRDRLMYPGFALPWVTDYIIDGHTTRSGSFHVFAGSNEGDLALLTPGEPGAPWSLEQVFTRGHTEIVRCALWDESSGILLTGGEDSKLSIWAAPIHQQGIQNDSVSMEVDSPMRKRSSYDGGTSQDYKRVRTD